MGICYGTKGYGEVMETLRKNEGIKVMKDIFALDKII